MLTASVSGGVPAGLAGHTGGHGLAHGGGGHVGAHRV